MTPLLVASFTFATHIIRSMSGSPYRQVAGPDKNSRDEYLETKGIFSLLDVFDVRWIGRGAFAHTEGSPSKTYPLALIIEPTPQRISTFLGTACALTFQIEVLPRLPWVVIDEIVVIVNSHLPLQEYLGIYVRPFENAHVYYIEINKPLPNQREFSTEYILAIARLSDLVP
jgi:hypothetical protein